MHARCRSFLIGYGAMTLLAGLLAQGGERRMAAATLALAHDESPSVEGAESGEALDFAAFLDSMDQGTPPAAAVPAPETCLANRTCQKASYCSKPEGECKGKGMCEPRPNVCPENYLPVCGCNDKTFYNSCWAAAAGVSLKAQGTCTQAVKCKSNAQCGTGDFCSKPDGKCDDEGICAQRPILCPPEVNPVCGCNGTTYNNRCEAFLAGVDVKHAGKCEK